MTELTDQERQEARGLVEDARDEAWYNIQRSKGYRGIIEPEYIADFVKNDTWLMLDDLKRKFGEAAQCPQPQAAVQPQTILTSISPPGDTIGPHN